MDPSPIITFDLGGVVVRMCSTIEEAAARAKVPWREPSLPERPDLVAHALALWQHGALSDRSFFEKWATAQGGRFGVDEAERISAQWTLCELEGVATLMRELRSAGYTLACLSNTCNHHWKLMHSDRVSFPSLQLFAHPHASHLLRAMKPDPVIYEKFEAALGVPGSDIVFFDDQGVNVYAARQRGWHAYIVDGGSSQANQMRNTLVQMGLLPPV